MQLVHAVYAWRPLQCSNFILRPASAIRIWNFLHEIILQPATSGNQKSKPLRIPLSLILWSVCVVPKRKRSPRWSSGRPTIILGLLDSKLKARIFCHRRYNTWYHWTNQTRGAKPQIFLAHSVTRLTPKFWQLSPRFRSPKTQRRIADCYCEDGISCLQSFCRKFAESESEIFICLPRGVVINNLLRCVWRRPHALTDVLSPRFAIRVLTFVQTNV